MVETLNAAFDPLPPARHLLADCPAAPRAYYRREVERAPDYEMVEGRCAAHFSVDI